MKESNNVTVHRNQKFKTIFISIIFHFVRLISFNGSRSYRMKFDARCYAVKIWTKLLESVRSCLSTYWHSSRSATDQKMISALNGVKIDSKKRTSKKQHTVWSRDRQVSNGVVRLKFKLLKLSNFLSFVEFFAVVIFAFHLFMIWRSSWIWTGPVWRRKAQKKCRIRSCNFSVR